MFIVSSFKLKFNEETKVYTVIPNMADSLMRCPLCGGELHYRDRKSRSSLNLAGENQHFSLRRLRCKQCERLHTEIPDTIQPFKHYDSATIQCVIEGSEKASECVADNSTMRRWKSSFREAEPDIAQRVASVYAQEANATIPLRVLDKPYHATRATIAHWLAFVMALLINHGHKLCTRFAFCPPPVACTIITTREKTTKGGGMNDKTIEDTG
jgi:predicted RNA-binding Zn-ribbon protein involved in translation (DUF1610 family)